MVSWWAHLRQEAADLLKPPAPPAPGLYTYPLSLDGGERRIHLRIEADGRGLLFVDVTDVIHLNPTAAELAKLALDGVPKVRAQAVLRRRYGVETALAQAEVARIYAMVDGLRNGADGCPVCAITPMVRFAPLFSVPVRAPYKADLALTYACNNACLHCYNDPSRKGMAPMSAKMWQRVIDKLTEIGVPHLILTGGEPTLHPGLTTIIRHADANGHIVGMNTNGRALSYRPLAEAVAQAGLNHVQITLESSRPEVHNAMVGRKRAFRQTVQGIRNALACGLHTITNTTLTRRNVDHALEVVDFVHDLGLRTFAMNGMIYAGGGLTSPDAIPAEELAATLVAVRERAEALGMRFLWYTVTDYCRLSPLELGLDPKRCNAAEYSICIEPNGDVLPCQSYYVAAGNILRDPWESIWESQLFRSFRERGENPQAAGLPEMCWDCPDLPVCGGGCRLEHEARTHTFVLDGGCRR